MSLLDAERVGGLDDTADSPSVTRIERGFETKCNGVNSGVIQEDARDEQRVMRVC